MLWWILASVSAYFVKGLCGFANTLVFSSVLSFTSSNVSISPVELLLGYPSNLMIAVRERSAIRWEVALPLLTLVLLGNIPGMLLLKNADTGMIKVLFGIVIVAVGLEMLWRMESAKEAKQSKAVLIGIGILSGVLCGLYGIGALLGAYVGRVTEDTHAFRANMCVVFTAENTFRIIAYACLGILTPEVLRRSLILFPFALLGLFMGFSACGRMKESLVRRIVIVMLIVSGAAIVLSNL